MEFKENSFVKGTHEELQFIADCMKAVGIEVDNEIKIKKNTNHLWYYKGQNKWGFASNLKQCCDHELSQSEILEAIKPQYWCIASEDMDSEAKEWFRNQVDVDWSFERNLYGFNGREDTNGFDSTPWCETAKTQTPPQITLKMLKTWFMPKKEEQPDFSILNETDVFYIETNSGNKYLFKGKDLFSSSNNTIFNAKDFSVHKNKRLLLGKQDVKSIRKATPEEIEPYKEHFNITNEQLYQMLKQDNKEQFDDAFDELAKDRENRKTMKTYKLNELTATQVVEVPKEDYDEFAKLADSMGFKWSDGDRYTEHNKQTCIVQCYHIKKGWVF